MCVTPAQPALNSRAQCVRPTKPAAPVAQAEGRILQAGEGERRVRRNVGKGSFIIKIDRQNGGSPDLVMGYEDIAPGAEIQRHDWSRERWDGTARDHVHIFETRFRRAHARQFGVGRSPVTPMSAEERAQIQAKHRWHTIAGPPPH